MSLKSIVFGLLKQPSLQTTYLLQRNNIHLTAILATKKALLKDIGPATKESGTRTTVVGVGQVGMACAFALLTQQVSTDLVLIDKNKDKLMGELLDIQHGSLFLKNPQLEGSTDFAASAGSKLVIIAAGVRQRGEETRLDLIQRNTEVFKKIIPQIVKYSPDAIILIVSNPVDVLSYVAWKISGLPIYKIIGSGTNLDSSRFRFLLSQKLQISPRSIHGWITGEHGNDSVALWSGVNIAGVRFRDVSPKVGKPDDPEKWGDIHKDVIQAAYKVRSQKGYTNWAIGLVTSAIAKTVIRNRFKIHAVSTHVKGHCGLDYDTFLSLPCVVARNGITKVVQNHMEPDELAAYKKAAETLIKVQNSIKW